LDSNGWTNVFRVITPGPLIWRGDPTDKTVYLTFDDGPTGPFTYEILDILDRYSTRATFFCVGDNVRKNPEIYRELLDRGHRTGNHSYHHLKGWKTPWKTYVADIYKAAELIGSDLFRPPYGKISQRQVYHLKKDFNIVMWSLLSLDYDLHFSGEQCLEIVNNNTSPGEIVVFHDNLKAEEKVRYALPRYLEKMKGEGFRFGVL
jgi:peptidoglycan/xylan/chitin deacetylase (PgdA/CDA1 family)